MTRHEHAAVRMRPFGLIAAVCAVALALPGAAGAGITQCIDTNSDNWQWLQPGTHGQEANVVRWIPERAEFVAMGDAVITTPDGQTWTPGHRFAPSIALDFVWNATVGEFLVVAEDGTRSGGAILSSSDLVFWTTVATLDWLPSAIAWDGSRYVVVGDYSSTAPAGNALTSTDGTTWTRVDTMTAEYLGDVIFANGQFVAVGSAGVVRTSADGVTWTPQTSGTSDLLTMLHWTGSKYVATGPFADDLVASPDGVTWEAITLPADASELAVIGSTVYVLDHRSDLTQTWVYASEESDLVNWSITAALGLLQDLASNGIDYVAVGAAGAVGEGFDGWNWEWSGDPFASEEIDELVALGGVTLASTGSGKIGRSIDHGATWTVTNTATNRIGTITHNGDPSSPLFLAQLINGSGSITTTYETSSDGITWSSVTGPLGSQWFLFQGANGRFFAYKQGVLYSSVDGNTWSVFFDDEPYAFKYVEHHDGLWIVYGPNGRIQTSPDGLTWTERTSQASGELSGPATIFAGSIYLGSGDGKIVRSSDGITWEVVLDANGPIRALGASSARIQVQTLGVDYQSSDGASWNRATAFPAGGYLFTYDGSGWTNAGIFGITFSAAGREWAPRFAKATHENLRDIASMSDVVVAAGNYGMLTKVGDGQWQAIHLGSVAGMSSVATDGARLVAAGYRNGSSTYTTNAFFSSDDGLTWTERASRPTYSENVVFGDFGFVVANQLGQIYQSSNGADWTLRASFPTIYFTMVGWTGQRYVALGTNGEVVTSLDGVFFQQEPQTIPRYGSPWQGSSLVHRQDGANALTVLVGDIGRTWISTDHGRTWALGRSGSFDDSGFSSVELIGSEFVATAKGAIATSTNGIDWTSTPTLSGRWVSALAQVEMPGEAPEIYLVGNAGLVQRAPLDRECEALAPPIGADIFADGFESGDLMAWQ